MLWIALAVRFLLELCLLGGWGFAAHRAVDGPWQWPATIAVPLLVVAVWSQLLAPKAPHRLPTAGQWILEAVLFGGAGLALWWVGAGPLGGALVALWLLDRLAITALGGLPPAAN